MAEKRRSSPCSMLSLKAHAFSVEALIGAEKQQQLQKKRRKLGAEEAAGAVDDGGCGCGSGAGAGEKGSTDGDEGATLPPSAGAASGPARGCADLERSCGSRGTAGESAPSRLTANGRVPSRAPWAGAAAGSGLLRALGVRARRRDSAPRAPASRAGAQSLPPSWPRPPCPSGHPPDGSEAASSLASRAAAAHWATRARSLCWLSRLTVQICAFCICLPWDSSQWVLFFLC
ncbi:hypothetical protein MC885_013037 [Smutsia gigantea]|nr:hypothetical protein MC885_013037 [Smutsia gigantea]